jgi:RHS repeat-associated protein
VINLSIGDKQAGFSYQDGMGRASQSIKVKISPTQKDMVQPVAYDANQRPSISYLPYAITSSSGDFRPNAVSEQTSFYANPPSGVTADSKAFATTFFEDSPLERVLGSTQVGNDFQATTASLRFKVNSTGDDVRKWDIVSGLPRSTSTYPEGSLSVEETEDETGTRSQTFTDFAGRLILEKRQSGPSNWYNTYYVYNDYGELLFIIPPQSAGTISPSAAHSDLWHFRYEYDDLGRQTGSKAPGTDWLYTIYDRWDRPVLTQDGEQRAKSPQEWSYIKYDVHNRPVVSGVISTTSSRSALTTAVANSTTRDEVRNSSSMGYTLNRTYPVTATESTITAITYYDDYSFRTNTNWSTSNPAYAFSTVSGYPEPNSTTVKGLVTGSKSRSQGTDIQWIHSVTYYDDEYRPIQSISSHQMGGTIKTVTAYSFAGEVEKSLDLYTYTGGSTNVERRYTYDHAGRPLKVYHRVNSEPEVMLSHFQYNDLGEATDIIHHSRNDGGTWLYKTNLKATIQGWTDEIQYSYSNDNPVFRQKLDYNKASGTGNATRLDGIISSNQWKHYGSEPERAYNYTYDTPKRLTGATYREKSGSSWSTNNLYNENSITYNGNGNITALQRYRENSGASAKIDQLTYTYTGNRLTGVSDTAPSAHKADGFDDGHTGTDYSYNQNGFLTSDANKGITAISYTRQDQPAEIKFGSANNIRYTYSAGGSLLTIEYTGSGAFSIPTRQYVGELIFEDDLLTEIRHEYGRVMTDAGNRYQYYLSDHLGNTRVVLQEDPAHYTVMATFESGSLEEESMQFMDYEESPRIAANLYDHTGTEEVGHAIRLSDGMTGPARSVAVLPGDTVRMAAYGKYLDFRHKKVDPALMAVSLAMMGSSPGIQGIDGNLSTVASSGSGAEQGLAGLLVGKEKRNEAPPAYLNYLFFDKEMNYKYGGYTQMTEAAYEDGSNREHEQLYQEVVAEEPGYFYIYVSNDGTEGGEAYFDDFTILTLESYIVQQTDYYPYGLVARNFVRENEKETLDLFQGKTYEELTGWYDFHARQYDAALGRWFGVDPQNQFASPYLTMGNNPVMMVDPDGEFVVEAMIIGAVVNTVIQGATGNIKNFGDFALAMGVGAVSGGAGFGAGQAVAGAVGTIGFAGGALTGAAGGFVGGFVGGAGNAWAGGASFGNGLGAGLTSGGYGALTGGVIGGLSGGIHSVKHGGNFWSGKGATFANTLSPGAPERVEVGDGLEYSNEYAKKFSDNNFGKIKGLNELHADNTLHEASKYKVDGDYFVSGSTKANAVTTYLGTGKASNVYFAKAAFSSAKQLYITMGHEYLHVGFYHGGFDNYIKQHASIAKWEYSQANLWDFRSDYYLNRLNRFNGLPAYNLQGNPNWFPPINTLPWPLGF